MKQVLLLMICLFLLTVSYSTRAQNGAINGYVKNTGFDNVQGVSITVQELAMVIYSDSNGYFQFTNLPKGKYTLISSIPGYESYAKYVVVKANQTTQITYALKPRLLDLKEVVVKGNNPQQANVIGKLDMQLRPVSSSQDLLRLVPGLFIAQHAGGGKAEQIFLRGFDVDHGTDFAIYVDGIPVNMPSHAHGQGYADLHFLIPETVRELEVNKGPYVTKYGDLATSGSGEFKTLNAPDRNQVKLEYGMFNTKRLLTMINLLDGNKHIFSKKNEQLYVAGEYRFTDSYFTSKQNFNRANLFTKYTGTLGNGAQLQFTVSTFQSSWNASGQIPERKVTDGTITRFGSIDPTEGGQTGRTNVNMVYLKPLRNGSFKNQLYYSRYDFNLYSNFTFFLNDSVNGDQINQADHRNVFGYVSTLQLNNKIGNKKIQSTFGAGTRYDNSDIQLNHTVQRVMLNEIVHGRLNQLNAWAYADENIDLSAKLRVNMGARVDLYNFNFNNHTYDTASGQVTKALVSPKLNVSYTLNQTIQLFAKSGFGFHSNDARAVVIGKLQNTLPRAFGYEAGATFKPFKRMLMNVALWGLDLQSELVYVGDEGVVEAAGRTRRLGVDLGLRCQVVGNWFVDADVNMNNGKLRDEPANANKIPLAPTFTSIGGISYKKSAGWSGSLRYRYMGSRAAIEDNSIIAKGYLLADAVLNYAYKKYQFGLSAENLLNAKWNEAQFATGSRLKNEAVPVNEIHYTPGTPFFLRGTVSYFF